MIIVHDLSLGDYCAASLWQLGCTVINAAAISNTLLVFHTLLENLQLISPSRVIVLIVISDKFYSGHHRFYFDRFG